MNSYIEQWNNMPFALWNGLSITAIQAISLMLFITSTCYWLITKKRQLLHIALYSLMAFSGLRCFSFYNASQQKRIIVYNVPKLQAIDIVEGQYYNFIGDSDLLYDGFNRNFHLQPARLQQRVAADQKTSLKAKNIEVQGKHIFIIDGAATMGLPQTKIDLLILSKNPHFYFSQLTGQGFPAQVVIDGSVPGWKARLWQHDCDSLHIPCFNVQERGAYIMEFPAMN